jgi:hypothetical protein
LSQGAGSSGVFHGDDDGANLTWMVVNKYTKLPVYGDDVNNVTNTQ